MEHGAWHGEKDRRGGLFWRGRRGFKFESRKFLIWWFLTPKTTILLLKTAIFGTII
jgi:hypothetical protein